MKQLHYIKSASARTLWMVMAVFFLVFCSCPVKKYIRLHLYNQKAIAEKADGSHLNSYDVKDCTIADRHNGDIAVLHLFHQHTDDWQPYTSFFFVSILSGIAFFFYRRRQENYIVSLLHGKPMPIPLFLWVRHLQV